MANTTGQIDTCIEIVTPENIAFQYRVAGPFRRLPAFLIDLAIRLAVAAVGLVVAIFGFGSIGSPTVGLGIMLLVWFVLAWFYGGLFETFWNGQTPGKRLMGIRVVSVEGQPITPFQAILRNFLREVDAQPFIFYQIGLLAAILNDRFQRLGDLAAGTMVVVEQERYLQGVVPSNEPEAVRISGLIPLSFQPGRSFTRALAAYVQCRRLFPRGRRLELARYVAEPLREQFRLPADTDLDMLLCGLYRRTFLVEREERTKTPQRSLPIISPVAETAQPDEAIASDESLPTTQ
jgi:uncharacterized RDD family membrane protein YckC